MTVATAYLYVATYLSPEGPSAWYWMSSHRYGKSARA